MTADSRPVYVIDGARFETFAGFTAACNESFIHAFGGDWHGHLDAFNDYLWWSHSPGGESDESAYVLVWKQSEKSRADFEREQGEPGKRLFHTLVEIIRSQEYVELRLE